MRKINFNQTASSKNSWLMNGYKKAPQLQKLVSFFLTLMLLVFSAWILGQIVWMFQSSFDVERWVPKRGIVTNTTNTMSLDMTELKTSDIFGAYNATPVAAEKPAVVVQDAPKTQLNLTLVGVVATQNPAKSLAVVANSNSQSTYGINEEIDRTGAKVKAIFNDRIIIDNSGKDETLMLDGVDNSKPRLAPTLTGANVSRPQPSRQNIQTSANNNANDDSLDNILAAIAKNPRVLFQYVRLSQVKGDDDNIIGYRVSPGKNMQLFEAVGLQDGDIAKALNGQDLTSPDAMNKIFQSVSDLTEINLTVERDEQLHDVYIQF